MRLGTSIETTLMPPALSVVAPRRDCDGWSVFRNPASPSLSSRMCLTGKSSSRRIASSTVQSRDWFGSWASGVARGCLPPNGVGAEPAGRRLTQPSFAGGVHGRRIWSDASRLRGWRPSLYGPSMARLATPHELGAAGEPMCR